MKNLICLVFILISFGLSAQSYASDQIVYSTVDSPAFELSFEHFIINIDYDYMKIQTEVGIIELESKSKIDTDSLDMIEYLVDGITYEVYPNEYNITSIEMIPNDDETLFGIKTIYSNGDTVYYNHLK